MASSENSQLVFDFDTISTLNYCACACMALLLYYNLTTFDEEAKHYTRHVLTGASVLYLLNRYLPLAVVIYNGPFWSLSRNKVRLALLSRIWKLTYDSFSAVEVEPHRTHCYPTSVNVGFFARCGAEQYLGLVLESLQCLPWAGEGPDLHVDMLTNQRRLWLAQIIFVCSLSPVVITTVAAHWTIVYVDPLFGCSIDEPMPMYLTECCTCSFMFQNITLLTMDDSRHCRAPSLNSCRYRGNPDHMEDAVRRPQALEVCQQEAYLCDRHDEGWNDVLRGPNTVEHMPNDLRDLGFRYQVFTDSTGPGILSKFIEPLTAILVSSFLTDLHKAASAATNQDSLLSMGTVEFRVIGSIGASLPGPGEGVEDETLAGETVLDDETLGRLFVSRDGMEMPRQPEKPSSKSSGSAIPSPKRTPCISTRSSTSTSISATSSSNKDEEGFARGWASSGVKMDVDEPLPAAPVGPKWGDKEWTRKVEAAYWHALPTPPPTPPADGASPGSVFEYADRLAVKVLSEVTGAQGNKVGQWMESLDGEAEEKRRTLFRTQYRAVESEVVGLAVKW
ncbi:hypothetical protein NUW54_g7102 [Trametes sanguinea]|uniref:Uncharacterized protein n=1 Tax=Trametes sanguinea TaxID=158606 RepID=A0ACC1PPQ7_9APHY|nr:hypothetical protein NUW54_g7102 [Trametes sanguinea]